MNKLLLSEEAIKNTIDGLISMTQILSDREYQQRVWIRCEGPECFLYEDAACDFLPICRYLIRCWNVFGLQANQRQALTTLCVAFNTFDTKNEFPELLLESSEWIKITELAKGVLNFFPERLKSNGV